MNYKFQIILLKYIKKPSLFSFFKGIFIKKINYFLGRKNNRKFKMFKIISLLLALLIIIGTIHSELDFGYHGYASIISTLTSFQTKFPDKVYLYSIGKSVKNRDLLVIAIADSKPNQHVSLRPEVKYIGNMHGNEVPSKEILLHLVDYMLNNQNTDSSVDFVMKNTRLHILSKEKKVKFIKDSIFMVSRKNPKLIPLK